jgi:thiamine monophosphate synthase
MLIVAFIVDKSETIALAIILYGVHVSSSTSQYSMACIAIRLIEPYFGKS